MQIHLAGAQEVLQTTRSSNQNLEVTILAHKPLEVMGEMAQGARDCKIHEA